MQILPAIDIIDGQCVRLTQGDYEKKTVYSADPVEVAKKFEAAGADFIHLVDLDGAKDGLPVNLETVRRIAKSVKTPLELGGGIRRLETIEEVLNAGVSRVIIGTSALEKPDLVISAVEKFGSDRVVVGIDAKKGLVAVRGWIVTTTKKAVDLAHEMVNCGVKRFIYTDIARDGLLEGPNLEELKRFTQAVGVSVIASGGVSRLEDIKNLMALESIGVEGAIIGKAYYEGKIELDEAVRVAHFGNVQDISTVRTV